MKQVILVSIVCLLLLVACGGNETANTVQPTTAVADVEEEMAEPTATAVPEPTTPPEPTAPPMITTAEEMVGIWEGTVAGEKGYLMYTADGRYFVSL